MATLSLNQGRVGQADGFRDLTELFGEHQAHCRRSKIVPDRDGEVGGFRSVARHTTDHWHWFKSNKTAAC